MTLTKLGVDGDEKTFLCIVPWNDISFICSASFYLFIFVILVFVYDAYYSTHIYIQLGVLYFWIISIDDCDSSPIDCHKKNIYIKEERYIVKENGKKNIWQSTRFNVRFLSRSSDHFSGLKGQSWLVDV